MKKEILVINYDRTQRISSCIMVFFNIFDKKHELTPARFSNLHRFLFWSASLA